MQELELINRLKTRDDSAYRFIMEKYQGPILNCCFKFLKNKEIAEDVTQEVFLEVYKSIDRFRSESRFSTWLFRIAITKSLDYLKSMKRKKRAGFLKSLFAAAEAEQKQPASDLDNPLQALENEDRIKVLSWAIDSLSENQKVAFTLSKIDEMSSKEIAEILHTSVSSVESLVFRAKANLKKKLYGYYQKHL
jgi:RNA polymerase sigma-70 factor, ECF subfamily